MEDPIECKMSVTKDKYRKTKEGSTKRRPNYKDEELEDEEEAKVKIHKIRAEDNAQHCQNMAEIKHLLTEMRIIEEF